MGQTSSTLLLLTPAAISGHLLSDWLPSVPAPLGTSFMGWPQFLLELTPFKGTNVLALRNDTGRSERQWKSVMSWMLGVAATRRFLETEGYRWVAPLSAFYKNAVAAVDLSAWNPAFRRSCVVAERRSDSLGRLMPDYLALRPTSSVQPESRWALVESKGTRRSLTQLSTCPDFWAAQVRSARISVHAVEVTSPRHLVVATRVNPNGWTNKSRRLQTRAWNRSQQESTALLPDAAVEIAAAHLFGLFNRRKPPIECARNRVVCRNQTRISVTVTTSGRHTHEPPRGAHSRSRGRTRTAHPTTQGEHGRNVYSIV